ncbi:MAG: hypothetical protein JWO77_1403 [Ilumatobacteraceae bacterium]|nr:hypothetical protein [Ilumatobacteraceae bacterium]
MPTTTCPRRLVLGGAAAPAARTSGRSTGERARPRSACWLFTSRVTGGVLVGLLLLGGVACGRHRGHDLERRVRAEIVALSKTARARGFTEQANALADGEVTDVEYDALHSLYRECMAKTDVILSPAHRSPIDGRTWIEWYLNGDELTVADTDLAHDCQLRFVDVPVIDLQPRPMAEPLRGRVQRCLGDAGVELEDEDRDIQQIYRRTGEANVVKLGDCLMKAMDEEYPEIETFDWGPPSVS